MVSVVLEAREVDDLGCSLVGVASVSAGVGESAVGPVPNAEGVLTDVVRRHAGVGVLVVVLAAVEQDSDQHGDDCNSNRS
jgi:hypothetical protein